MKTLCVLLITTMLSGCIATERYSVRSACSMREYCPERDGPRQYVRAPDGWGGKYCLQNPTEC